MPLTIWVVCALARLYNLQSRFWSDARRDGYALINQANTSVGPLIDTDMHAMGHAQRDLYEGNIFGQDLRRKSLDEVDELCERTSMPQFMIHNFLHGY